MELPPTIYKYIGLKWILKDFFYFRKQIHRKFSWVEHFWLEQYMYMNLLLNLSFISREWYAYNVTITKVSLQVIWNKKIAYVCVCQQQRANSLFQSSNWFFFLYSFLLLSYTLHCPFWLNFTWRPVINATLPWVLI